MALKNIVGIDHAVVVVRDLDQAAENWRRLGFTVSPRGTHSAKMGTGNATIMLGPDYIELLGVLTETEHNAPTRAYLARHGEGIERIAFTAIDAAAGAEEIRARGYAALGPTDFERPVTMPDGTLSAAKFRTFQWPIEEAPAGLRIFACQHKTRETVWIPQLQQHANAANCLKRALVVSPDPAKDAAHLARLIDRDVSARAGWRRYGGFRFGPCRFPVPDKGPIAPPLSRRLAGGTSRAWRRRARARNCGPRRR